MAVYPRGFFSWLNRVDNQDVDYAEDPNSLAAEIIAVETTLGVNPQVEARPPLGNAQAYDTMSDRVSANMLGLSRPVCSLVGANQSVPSGASLYNTFGVDYDPFSMFNGQDITIPVNAWWIITASNNWSNPQVGTGFSLLSLMLNGVPVNISAWRWDFPNSNLLPHIFSGSPFISVNPGGPSAPTSTGADSGYNTVTWQGLAHAGDRFQARSSNGTTINPHVINSYTLKACYLRSISGTFASG